MLDHLDDCGRVESSQTRIAIHQGTVEESNAFALFGSETIQLEARFRQIERPTRDVHADDLGELVIGQQSSEQLALAAPKIEYASRPRSFQRSRHGLESPFVEADRAFD